MLGKYLSFANFAVRERGLLPIVHHSMKALAAERAEAAPVHFNSLGEAAYATLPFLSYIIMHYYLYIHSMLISSFLLCSLIHCFVVACCAESYVNLCEYDGIYSLLSCLYDVQSGKSGSFRCLDVI
uniref:Uncharacterized protein n=1 Tax=Arundo donax TaxID=35708 RepID=A0A0A9U3A9_ARUDO